MELREWLIILGLALVTLIVIDGVRRLKRQRRVPRLDQAGEETGLGGGASPDAEEDTNWELPNGGARVVNPASYATVKPKPKLQRQEHPGPSRVLSGLRSSAAGATSSTGSRPDTVARPSPEATAPRPADRAPRPSAAATEAPSSGTPETERASAASSSAAAATPSAAVGESAAFGESAEPHDSAAPQSAQADSIERREPTLSALDEPAPGDMTAGAPLSADPGDHDGVRDEDEHYRLVDLEGVGDSLKSGSRRMGESVQRFGSSVQQRLAERRERKREAREEKARRAERERAEQAAQRQRDAEARQQAEAAERRHHRAETTTRPDEDDPLFAAPRSTVPRDSSPASPGTAENAAVAPEDEVVRAHPTLERALRHDVSAERARDTLSHAEEVIVISVMARDEGGFSGAALLDLMLACGLRYSSEMGIFHRFETEDPDSELQFSMVNVLKPGTFPIEAMDDFTTPGVTLLMPLPGAVDTAAAFEAMVETAMVIVRHLGGELKDENQSVMTAQTVGFARQRVQEFERRYRLSRCQAN